VTIRQVTATVPDGQNVEAFCNSGEMVVGGGFDLGSIGNADDQIVMHVASAIPIHRTGGRDSYRLAYVNDGVNNEQGPAQAYAICMAP